VSCRCYDGPYSEQVPRTLVSVRCPEHYELPPKTGHSLMLVDDGGKIVKTAARDKITSAQAAKVTQTTRAKKYGTTKPVKKGKR